jgi:hypothetical protein
MDEEELVIGGDFLSFLFFYLAPRNSARMLVLISKHIIASQLRYLYVQKEHGCFDSTLPKSLERQFASQRTCQTMPKEYILPPK